MDIKVHKQPPLPPPPPIFDVIGLTREEFEHICNAVGRFDPGTCGHRLWRDMKAALR